MYERFRNPFSKKMKPLYSYNLSRYIVHIYCRKNIQLNTTKSE